MVFLLSSAFIIPALAQSEQAAEKFTFYAKQQPTGGGLVDSKITQGMTWHGDLAGAGLVTIWKDPAMTGPKLYASKSTSSSIDVNINLKTGLGNIKYDMTWQLASDGWFEGNIVGKLQGEPFVQGSINYANVDLHAVLQGKGSFAGQTIIIDGSKAAGYITVNIGGNPTQIPAPFYWTGTWIIP
jgi:hypothetical protein